MANETGKSANKVPPQDADEVRKDVPKEIRDRAEIDKTQEKLDDITGRDRPGDRYPEQRRQ